MIRRIVEQDPQSVLHLQRRSSSHSLNDAGSLCSSPMLPSTRGVIKLSIRLGCRTVWTSPVAPPGSHQLFLRLLLSSASGSIAAVVYAAWGNATVVVCGRAQLCCHLACLGAGYLLQLEQGCFATSSYHQGATDLNLDKVTMGPDDVLEV